MASKNLVEPCIVLCSLLLYGAYHVQLWRRFQRDPMSTTIGHNHEARRLWCETMMVERREILAVQTIRNTMMSSSLLASTSLTLSAVVAAYLVNTIKAEGLFGLDIFSSAYIHPVHKFFVIIMLFTIAFYCYMQSVRASNHASYLVSIPISSLTIYAPSYVCRVIQCGANFHTAGTRIFYMAFLCVVWLFGPLPLAILTLLLISHLYYQDRVVAAHETDTDSYPHSDSASKHDTGASPVNGALVLSV